MCFASAVFSQIAHAQDYWIKSGNLVQAGSIRAPDSSLIEEWQIILYRPGEAHTGRGGWGLLTRKTAEAVMKQLHSAQEFDIAYARFMGGNPHTETMTSFNPMGPIAVLRERLSPPAAQAPLTKLMDDLARARQAFQQLKGSIPAPNLDTGGVYRGYLLNFLDTQRKIFQLRNHLESGAYSSPDSAVLSQLDSQVTELENFRPVMERPVLGAFNGAWTQQKFRIQESAGQKQIDIKQEIWLEGTKLHYRQSSVVSYYNGPFKTESDPDEGFMDFVSGGGLEDRSYEGDRYNGVRHRFKVWGEDGNWTELHFDSTANAREAMRSIQAVIDALKKNKPNPKNAVAPTTRFATPKPIETRPTLSAEDSQAIGLEMSGRKAAASGNFSEAVQLYSRAIEVSPKRGQALVGRALAKIELKDFQGALEDAEMARSKKAIPSTVAIARAKAYIGIGDYEKAASAYNSLLLFKPRLDLPTYVEVAIANTNAGNYPTAIKHYTSALALPMAATQRSALLYDRGRCKQLMEDFNGARADFDAAQAMSGRR